MRGGGGRRPPAGQHGPGARRARALRPVNTERAETRRHGDCFSRLARLGEARAPARPGFTCSAPAIGCRPPAFIPNAHVLPNARGLPNACGFLCARGFPFERNLPLRARRRRPERAPRTCSHTPLRGTAPPQDESPLRNHLERRRGARRDGVGRARRGAMVGT